MRRFFVCFAVFAAMVLMVSCGGSGSSEKNYEKDNGGTCSQEEEDKYKCMDGASYRCSCAEMDYETGDCKKYLWQNPITCSGGCNEWSGVCECSEEEADAENHECMSDYQLKCSRDSDYKVADYFWHIDLFCINGCDTSTGKCNPCRYDTFTCYFEKEWNADYSYKCEDGHFEEDELCLNGCDKSTGKCNPCEEGSFICKEWDSDYFSYKCEEGHFESDGLCINGCNKSTGQCNFCEYGTFACYGNDSYKCKEGRFERYEGCDENGCDSSTGKCKNSTVEECSSEGDLRCKDNILQKCKYEKWRDYEQCDEGYSCNAEKGFCEAI